MPNLIGLAAGACLIPSIALAQGGLEIKSNIYTDAQAVAAAAAAGFATTSQVNAVAATVPAPASSVPNMEVVGGAIGTAGTYRPGNAVQPRISRTMRCTTASGGTCTLTWPDIGNAAPVLIADPEIGSSATQVPVCNPVSGTVTATGATVKCFVTQSILGLGIVPFTTAAAGVVVHVLAFPPS